MPDPSRIRSATVAIRRVRLGFLLVWRRRFPSAEEADAQRQRDADRRRGLEELRLAAEAYHWAVNGKRETSGVSDQDARSSR